MADLFEKYVEMAIKCGIIASERESWALKKMNEEEERNQRKMKEEEDRIERASRRELEKEKLRLLDIDKQREHELKLAELSANNANGRSDGQSSSFKRLKLKIFKENVDDMDTISKRLK